LFLKRLEIQGFKSFAEKTEIEFNGGVTGVVGPNGCGKSNISDSLRWVLGEQSAKTLRGSKMEDVIFSGSAKRKPLGFAEVTLVLDNKDESLPIDYSEVSVTRRVFRSGESEYYINRNSCRLKDIRELFMDTGVGKDGYSIIGQGRIDEILSSKSEDRRNIFEEAAGIVKYKTRKEEAEKKLEKTKDNLTRINDIVNELGNQIEPLSKQAEKTREFLKLSDRLKNLELNIFIRDIDRLKEEITQLDTQKSVIIEQLNSNEEKRNELEKKYNKVKLEIDKMEESIENIQNLMYSTQSQLEKNESELKLNSEKTIFLKKEAIRNDSEIKRLQDEIDKIETQKKQTEVYKKEIESNVNILNDELTSINEDLNRLNAEIEFKEKHIEEKKGDLIQFLNKISDKKSKINSLNSFNQSIEKRISQVQFEIDDLTKQGEVNEKNLSNTSREIEKLKENLVKLNDDKIEKSKQEDILIKKYESVQIKINSLKEKIQGNISNYKLLKEMKDEYEGFHKSVKKALMACKNNINLGRGTHGVVAELISVDKEYEKAIEVSLGASLQNIITDNQEDAKKIINYLKANKLGRVTFLPISAINSRTLSSSEKRFLSEPGVIGIASELISFDNKYRGIFEYLLGRVIIVKTLDDGIRLSKLSNYKFKIVTITGDTLNPGGSMTGGSYNNNTNLLGRERQIKNLEKLIKSLGDEKEQELTELSNIKHQIDLIKLEINKIESSISSLKLELAKLDNKCEQYVDAREKNNNLINRYTLEKNKLVKEREESEHNISILQDELEKLNAKNDTTQDDIEEQLKYFEKQKVEKDILQNKAIEKRVKLATLQQELKSIIDTIQRQEDEKLKMLNEISIKEVEKEDSIKEISSINESFSILEENRKKYSEQILEYDTKLNELKIDKNNFMQSFYAEQEKMNNMNKMINELQKSINSVEVKREKYSMQLENINTRMWEDYDMTYQMALSFKQNIDSITKVQNEIRSIKNSIKNLGNINLDAIEEYEKLNERYNFIQLQKEDLINAKESLNSVIKDMDTKMKEQFIENFLVIKEHFSEIFTKLFGGGKADVFLQDEDNILTSGIEIIAQPPGKKLQNLSLLSGGERALTAIALLFAILKTKPTPFCILDEIEAALDDANVYRYAEYLKEFSNETQFIVITHRKGTMESVDSLYGVTMEEEGISKLISVKLSDKLKEMVS